MNCLTLVIGVIVAKIQCALFKGTNRSVFIDKREFGGSIYTQSEEAYKLVLQHIKLVGLHEQAIFTKYSLT